MAWIELHQSLPTHRKTLIASDILDISPVRFVGHIVAFWLWCLDNVPDGNLNGISPRMIARAAQWESDHDNFLQALLTAGFLDQTDTLEIHDWFDYAGRLVERREAERERSKQRRLALRASQDNTQKDQQTTAGRPPDDQQTTAGTVPNRTLPNHTVPVVVLTDDEAAFIQVLESIKGYPIDRTKDLEMYHELQKRYPKVDILEATKDWAVYKKDHPLEPKSNPRSQLNTSCKNCEKWGKNQKGVKPSGASQEHPDEYERKFTRANGT